MKALLFCVGMAGAGLFLNGCMQVSPNREADVQALQEYQIEKGKTTKSELVAHFGQPPTDMEGADGTETMTWSYTHIDIDTGSVVVAAATSGLAGMGHGTGHSCILQVTLRNGTVVDFTRTVSNTNG